MKTPLLLQAQTRKKDILGFSGIVYEGDKEVIADCCCLCSWDDKFRLLCWWKSRTQLW